MNKRVLNNPEKEKPIPPQKQETGKWFRVAEMGVAIGHYVVCCDSSLTREEDLTNAHNFVKWLMPRQYY